MKPRITLAEARTAEGRRLVLSEQDGAFAISLNGQELMHSRAHASEVLLGELGVASLHTQTAARVLVGGLGLGFTLVQVLAMVASSNRNIYSGTGLRHVKRVLKPGGRAIFWSASADAAFEKRLQQADFKVEAVPAKVHANAKRFAYLLYVAQA